MKYKVIVQPPAEHEINAAYAWIAEQSPEAAARWSDGLFEAIDSLKRFPKRCALAPENEFFDAEIRQLLYGKRGGVYRVLLMVRDDVVYILHVRHGAQKPLEPDENEGLPFADHGE